MYMCVDFKNPFVIIFIVGTVLSFIIYQFLEFIDFRARVKNGGKVPEILADIPAAKEKFNEENLKKICEYENAKYFAWIPSSLLNLIMELSLIIFGFYPFVFNMVTGWFGFPAGVGSTWLVFAAFLVLSSIPAEILALPFSLYREFVVEKKFGFSNMTIKLWLLDQLKELLVGAVLGSVLIFVASLFFVKCADSWWWILAAVLIGFTFLMQIVYPKFIAPLFNKFEPLPEGEVKDKITKILNKCGFKNGGLFVMDASKRSGHSNAYFSGFGKAKRIVLYDTLINSMTSDELASVLGHELGHYKLHHITKRLCVMIPLEFILLFVLYKLAQFTSLYEGFGFTGIDGGNVAAVQFIGLFLATEIYGAISEILSPVMNFSSRRDEYQADAYAKKVCGTGDHLISGLIKLNAENLSELLPPKLYVMWNFSHPTLVERVTALKKED